MKFNFSHFPNPPPPTWTSPYLYHLLHLFPSSHTSQCSYSRVWSLTTHQLCLGIYHLFYFLFPLILSFSAVFVSFCSSLLFFILVFFLLRFKQRQRQWRFSGHSSRNGMVLITMLQIISVWWQLRVAIFIHIHESVYYPPYLDKFLPNPFEYLS